MRRPTRRGQAAGGRRRGYVPPKSSSPLPMIAGIGSGVFVLVIIIAVAASGGDGPAPTPPPVSDNAPPANVGGRTVNDTGSILFICANSPKHGDKEVVIRQCASCSTRSQFFAEGGYFYCFSCKNAFPKDRLVCDESACAKPARRSRIKR